MSAVPTLSQVRAWGVGHLTDAATHWTATATVWEDTFTQLTGQIGAPGGTPWIGEAADAAQGRAYADRLHAVGMADQLHAAAGIARVGAKEIRAARDAVLSAVDDARQAGFAVAEDFSASSHEFGSPAILAARQAEAEALAAVIRARVAELAAADTQIATKLTGAVALRDMPLSPGEPREQDGPPKTLQDLIVPAGGKPDPSVAPKNLDEALFPRGSVPPGPRPSMLDRANAQRIVAGQLPLSSLRDDPEFTSIARALLAKQGLSPAQIEQQIDATVKLSEQPIVSAEPPDPLRLPTPGFGEGFGDRWRSTEQSIKNLIGQGGPGAPGVVDSWKGLTDSISQSLTNPVGVVKDEIQHALDSPSPAYYLGEKAFDAAATATLPFGGEGAAVRAGLPSEIATAGGAPTALLRGWDPLGGMHPPEFQNLFGTPDTRIYPGNDGFPASYTPQPAHLPEGSIIDRFGSEYGRYLSPDGALFVDRALPPETAGAAYTRYLVTGEPLPSGWQIAEGPVEPFYGQVPAPDAIQYMIVGSDGVRVSVKDLVNAGVLNVFGPPLGR